MLTLDGIELFDSGDRDHTAGAVKAIAAAHASLTDDEQAQFFEEVGRIMETWPTGKMDTQTYYIGKHMATCACIGEAGRRFLQSAYETMAGGGGAR